MIFFNRNRAGFFVADSDHFNLNTNSIRKKKIYIFFYGPKSIFHETSCVQYSIWSSLMPRCVTGLFAVGIFVVRNFAVGHFAVLALRRKDISP